MRAAAGRTTTVPARTAQTAQMGQTAQAGRKRLNLALSNFSCFHILWANVGFKRCVCENTDIIALLYALLYIIRRCVCDVWVNMVEFVRVSPSALD